MGSTRKSKLKKKDFVKPKLKVGKTQTAANATNTEFKAKKITISKSTKDLVNSHGNTTIDYIKKLSILKKTTTNINSRKEIIAEFITLLNKDSSNLPLDDILKTIKILFLDQSKKIRSEARDILQRLISHHENLVVLNHDSIMLFIYSAMTHLKPTIRSDSVHLLNLIISTPQLYKLTIQNHWVRIWKNVLILLNWKNENKSYVDSNDFKDFNDMRVNQLQFLITLLDLGIQKDEKLTNSIAEVPQLHDLTANYFSENTLKLITQTSADNESTIDINDRVKAFVEIFGDVVHNGVEDLVKVEDAKISDIAKKLMPCVDAYTALYADLAD